jgi:NAD(P)-dependent dehydrogenase (short-subunit alcohol dehydrogenase family)
MNAAFKTAIVTGGTGALGRVIAETLFAGGARVAFPVHSEQSLSSVPGSIAAVPDRMLSAVTHLEADDQVNAFVQRVLQRFTRIDILVNAAGGYAGGDPIDDVPVEQWDAMMNTNLRTAFLMCRAVLPVMRRQRAGRIINIAAMPALRPGPNKGPYQISKRGVITLTETIAEEVKGTGITCNAIAPSIILTDKNRTSMPDADARKWVTPEEIASLVSYLCSDEARSMSGNVLKIYGGG